MFMLAMAVGVEDLDSANKHCPSTRYGGRQAGRESGREAGRQVGKQTDRR